MKTAINLIILAFITLSDLTTAQTQSCDWAQTFGGSGYSGGKSITTDPNGNVFVVGSYGFLEVIIGSFTLTNYGQDADILLVKYSPNGTVLWVKSIGGSGTDTPLGISTDLNGDVFIAGAFKSSILVLGTTTLTNPNGNIDFFVAKYSSSGTLLWVNSPDWVGNQFAQGSGLSTDANGNVFFTSSFVSPTIVFGTYTLTNYYVNNSTFSQNSDIFLVKYSPTGSVLWATSAGGRNEDVSNGVSADINGNVFITVSSKSDTINFGTMPIVFPSGHTQDIAIAKYSPSGTALWVNTVGGDWIDDATGIATDPSGNVFVCGETRSSKMVFGTDTLKNHLYASDIFIAKYSPAGSLLWAKLEGGDRFERSYGLSTDASGNVFMIGTFGSDSITFGDLALNNFSYLDTETLFIVAYSSMGNVFWVKSSDYGLIRYPRAITIDPNRNVYITGAFENGNVVFGTDTLYGHYSSDIFIAKFCISTVGINENLYKEVDINIYPNPFNSNATISFSTEQTNTTIRIVDAFGKELNFIPNFNGREIQIDRGKMEVGIYFIQVINENRNSIIKKLILQ